MTQLETSKVASYIAMSQLQTSKVASNIAMSQLQTSHVVSNIAQCLAAQKSTNVHTTNDSPLFLIISVLTFCASAGWPTIFTTTYGSTTSPSMSWFALGMWCPLMMVSFNCVEVLQTADRQTDTWWPGRASQDHSSVCRDAACSYLGMFQRNVLPPSSGFGWRLHSIITQRHKVSLLQTTTNRRKHKCKQSQAYLVAGVTLLYCDWQWVDEWNNGVNCRVDSQYAIALSTHLTCCYSIQAEHCMTQKARHIQSGTQEAPVTYQPTLHQKQSLPPCRDNKWPVTTWSSHCSAMGCCVASGKVGMLCCQWESHSPHCKVLRSFDT